VGEPLKRNVRRSQLATGIVKVVLIILLFFMPSHAQRKFDVCTVTTSAWSRTDGRGTGNMLLGEFRTTIGEPTTLKSISHRETGLIINASVKYLDFNAALKKKPLEIRIAISASTAETDAFDVLDNAVAGGNYKKDWGSLYVEKQVAVGDVVHTFTLYCRDGNTKRKK
jgi:hypothetical protein